MKAGIDANIPKVNPGGKFSSSAYGRRKPQKSSTRIVESDSSTEAGQDVDDKIRNVKYKAQDVKPDPISTTNNMQLGQVPGLEKHTHIEAASAVQNDDTKLDDSSVHVGKNEDDVLDAEIVDNGIAKGINKDRPDVAGTEILSEVDLIHVTVSLKNSPQCRVDNACQNSIFKIMDSKEHLKRNIIKGKVEAIRNTGSNDDKYEHEVDMFLQVRTGSLWEPARTYIWKHLGNGSSWKLQDGTEVLFVKIHRKSSTYIS